MRPVIMPVLLAALTTIAQAATGQSTQTTLTYQGRLDKDGAPYSGTVDLSFSVWNAPGMGFELRAPLTVPGVTVTDGLFTTEFGVDTLDLPVDGFWIEVTVDDGMSGPQTLSPRQRYHAAPAAVQAKGAMIGASDSVIFARGEGGNIDASNSSSNTSSSETSIWQSFLPTEDGRIGQLLVSSNVLAGAGTKLGRFRLYEGEGVRGTQLYEEFFEPDINIGVIFLVPATELQVSAGVQYTFELQFTELPTLDVVPQIYSLSNSDPYRDGRASTGPNDDLTFELPIITSGGASAVVTGGDSLTLDGRLVVQGFISGGLDPVQLPGGSIEAVEIEDESGISSPAQSSVLLPSVNYSPIAQAAINVPAPGYVVAQYQGDINFGHVNGTASSYDIATSLDPNNAAQSTTSIFLISASLPSAGRVEPLSAIGVYAVPEAATYDFYAVGRKRLSSSPTPTMERGRLILTYHATNYAVPLSGTSVDGTATPR
ncbi:MAG: hypothetical protein AAGB51_10945 [Planctomycetota bacterium]